MKAVSRNFNEPSQTDFEYLWKNAIISFDANVLLNVYQYGDTTLATFMDILDQLKDRLWLTHQAAQEYNKNRHSRIETQEKSFASPVALTELQEFRNSIKNLHHPMIDYSELTMDADALITKLQKYMASSDATNKFSERCEKMHQRVNEIFDEKVGPEYDLDTLTLRRSDAEKRYENWIPPGFRDWNNKAKQRDKEKQVPTGLILPDPFGDAIIWFQLLEFASAQVEETRKPIIFVTDDQKVDWWWIESGKVLGPRPELIAEMNRVGKSRFYMYDSRNFIKYAAEHVSKPPTKENLDSAMKEAQSVNEEIRRWGWRQKPTVREELSDESLTQPKFRMISGQELIGNKRLRFVDVALDFWISQPHAERIDIMAKITEICLRPLREGHDEVAGSDTTESRRYTIQYLATIGTVTIYQIAKLDLSFTIAV